ncbi:unnamed protein product, partial [Symbiodinium sp. CCMP2456]
IFNNVLLKKQCQLSVETVSEWAVKELDRAAAPVAAFEYFAVSVSRLDTVSSVAKRESYQEILTFLDKNTKSSERVAIPLSVKDTIVLFDSSVAALAAMHMVTKGLDAGETSVVKINFSVDFLKTVKLKVVPNSASVVSYSVLLAETPAELERIMTGALSVSGFIGKLSVSEGPNGYQDVRELKLKDNES